jgi:short-subunit dehydrogenase
LLLQGIGEALAKYLAAQGARLILSSRSADKLQV